MPTAPAPSKPGTVHKGLQLPQNPLIPTTCPSCRGEAFFTSTIQVKTPEKEVRFEVCGLCHTQAMRQPATFRLRFNPKSDDPIRDVLQSGLNEKK